MSRGLGDVYKRQVQDFTKLEAVSDSVNVSGSLIQTTGQPTLDAAAATLGLKWE